MMSMNTMAFFFLEAGLKGEDSRTSIEVHDAHSQEGALRILGTHIGAAQGVKKTQGTIIDSTWST